MIMLPEKKKAKMAPIDSIKYHRKHLQIGSMSVDPHTGEIKTWVGGTNFKYFKYDHVNSRRQVGSTFKPFVYATAIALQNISPCNEFQDVNIRFRQMILIFTCRKHGHPAMLKYLPAAIIICIRPWRIPKFNYS